jgi:SAM-dependent methyltransferase
MNSEKLRQLYNGYYKEKKNKWALNDLDNALQLVRKILVWTSLNKKNKKGYALDIGCAQGVLTDAIRQNGFLSIGIDYSDIAIEQAHIKFPQNQFFHMDAFNPSFNHKFDFILCRAFSGAYTHDLDFVTEWVLKYIKLLNDDGFFVLGITTDLSGIEKNEETTNWTYNEIDKLVKSLNVSTVKIKEYHKLGIISRVKKYINRILRNKDKKRFLYILLKK